MVSRIITSRTWRSPDTVAHARLLLGKFIVRRSGDDGVESQMITEVEAYDGAEDLACHASKGRTPRTEIMFAPGGIWYVYLCYGVHEMLNLVTGPRDHPAAILIRGLEHVTGPGRLTKALGITRAFNGKPAAPAAGLWIEDRGLVFAPEQIEASPRVGVDFAGPVWSQKLWRFTLREALSAKKQTPRTFR